MKSSLVVAALVVSSSVGSAQTTKKPTTSPSTAAPVAKTTPPASAGLTTLSGIYTRDEAAAGKEMYVGLCASCHQAIAHTGPAFRKKWTGKPLSELYIYMRTLMPKNDPGSLADEDYGVLLAYMLQMNGMPAGRSSLSTDTLELRKIRIDTVKSR